MFSDEHELALADAAKVDQMKEREETSFAKTRSLQPLLLPIGSFTSRGGGGMVLHFFFIVVFGIDQKNKSVATKKINSKQFPRDLWKKLCVMEVMNEIGSLL